MANEVPGAEISANAMPDPTNIYHDGRLEEKLRQVLGNDPTAVQWLNGLLLSMNGLDLRIGFIHSYFAFWFREQKQKDFEKALKEIFRGSLPRLVYKWPDGTSERDTPAKLPAPLELPLDTGGDPFDDFIVNKTSKKTAIDNGAAGLRGFADILTFLAIFGFCGAVICIIIELIDWRGFGIFTACCIAAIITRFVLSALATIAEAAARYLEESREKIREA